MRLLSSLRATSSVPRRGRPIYGDRTYCPFFEDCRHGIRCVWALRPEVFEEAEKADMDISRFLERPMCFQSTISITEDD